MGLNTSSLQSQIVTSDDAVMDFDDEIHLTNDEDLGLHFQWHGLCRIVALIIG